METILEKATIKESKAFKTYKCFQSTEQAAAYIELLKTHEIPYKAETAEQLPGTVFALGSTLLPKVVLKLLPEDFIKINEIIEEEIVNADVDLDGHHLSQLNNKELWEILEKPDEWSAEDMPIAKLLLQQRGVEVSDVEIQKLRTRRLQNVRQGRKASSVTMCLWFLAIVFIGFGNVVLMLGGIGMSYYYGYDKTTDPDGNSYFTFEPQTRKYGQLMLLIGIPLMLVVHGLFVNYMQG